MRTAILLFTGVLCVISGIAAGACLDTHNDRHKAKWWFIAFIVLLLFFSLAAGEVIG